MNLLYALDLIGTFVFAISGLRLAAKKEMDLFGASVIACVTAVGGGTVRDLLIGATPVAWITNVHYGVAIILAVPVTIIFRKYIVELKRTIFIFDSIGIALFTISGMEKAFSYGLSPSMAISMGVVSAVIGGVIRDILCNEIPLIFRKEIYATACLIGALFFFVLSKMGLNTDLNYILTTSLIFSIRVIAIKYNLSIPKIR
ncbi:trimeric intracellular cation channel family protein [Fulvivirga lutea]|uniref:Trimeric intracellular cation channel family protein n=1 Tax=Fulvivirga lutea TaxID=2810512 RepID=A0A974WFQ7_9BACT|nr:trimeric intracellular cation channel family protein [Fulvivirga lutea]QSE96934.1 trimeric intracellular cation channel family protein [Fulvivirga lutea]